MQLPHLMSTSWGHLLDRIMIFPMKFQMFISHISSQSACVRDVSNNNQTKHNTNIYIYIFFSYDWILKVGPKGTFKSFIAGALRIESMLKIQHW